MESRPIDRKGIRRSALMLAVVAAAFFIGFVIVTWIRAST